MGIRDVFKRTIDWAAEQVQATTGEKERRESVRTIKQLAEDFKASVAEAILHLNEVIKTFNCSIDKLNSIRTTDVKSNIARLHIFLSKFGKCKPIGAYAKEAEKLPAEFPEQAYDSIENYISNVDWSNDEVFLETFFLSPIGMKFKTRKQNLSLREHIHELQLLTADTLQELSNRELTTLQEIKVCEMYTSNVQFISRFISERIIPELELVEAFFEAEKIKNEILCDHSLQNLSFTYNLQSIQNTAYHRHYQFVKNTVAFYVISCCIYSTPVLTNLLQNQVTEDDFNRLKKEHSILAQQAKSVCDSMTVQRGEMIL